MIIIQQACRETQHSSYFPSFNFFSTTLTRCKRRLGGDKYIDAYEAWGCRGRRRSQSAHTWLAPWAPLSANSLSPAPSPPAHSPSLSLCLSLRRWRNDSGSVVSTRSVNFTELMSKFLSPKVGGEDKRWWWGKSVLKERLVEWRLHAMVSVSCPSRSQRTMIAWMRLPSGRRSSPCGGNPGSGTWTPCELLLWPSHVMPPPHLTLANNQRLA